MSSSRSINERYERCLAALKLRGQQHVLRWWPELQRTERDHLLGQIEGLPWDTLDAVIPTHVLAQPRSGPFTDLRPAAVYPRHPGPDLQKRYSEARELGSHVIRAGKVAAFTVAGGQGTRLGFAGPKGALMVTPVGGRSLFQLFAEMIHAASRRYSVQVPWYIMTSPVNHAETQAYFEGHSFFGLSREDVVFFPQGVLPAFDFQGRLLLAAKDELALSPDGHGGSLKALVTSGAIVDLRRRGIEQISYFQIDNPLVQPFDPLFLGLHVMTGSEMSTKVASKTDDLEKVGNVCLVEGRATVVEYSDFPAELAKSRELDGRRRFDSGNLAIHILDAGFVERVVGHTVQMPYRRAEKIVPFVDDSGATCHPTSPNGVKLETFVFDVLPLARTPLVLEVDRAEEFSPVKNETGVDSLETAKRAQIARGCRWLESAGVFVPRRADGSPDVEVVISPLFALDAKEVQAKMEYVPPLRPGDALYLE